MTDGWARSMDDGISTATNVCSCILGVRFLVVPLGVLTLPLEELGSCVSLLSRDEAVQSMPCSEECALDSRNGCCRSVKA